MVNLPRCLGGKRQPGRWKRYRKPKRYVCTTVLVVLFLFNHPYIKVTISFKKLQNDPCGSPKPGRYAKD